MATSANNDPIFISQHVHWDAELNNQVFTRSGGALGTTAPVLLGTAGDNGGVISSVSVEVSGNAAANVCVLYSLRSGATAVRKRAEVSLPAVTGSNTSSALAGYAVHFVLPDYEPFEGCVVELLRLEAKESLYVALLQAEVTSKFTVHATGGLYDPT